MRPTLWIEPAIRSVMLVKMPWPIPMEPVSGHENPPLARQVTVAAETPFTYSLFTPVATSRVTTRWYRVLTATVSVAETWQAVLVVLSMFRCTIVHLLLLGFCRKNELMLVPSPPRTVRTPVRFVTMAQADTE